MWYLFECTHWKTKSTLILMLLTLLGWRSQLRRFQSTWDMLGGVWYKLGVGSLLPLYMPVNSFNLLPGAMPLLPRSEHSHQPSNPSVSCSTTVRISPRRNASSSGDSAMLSYNALARNVCKTITRGWPLNNVYILVSSTIRYMYTLTNDWIGACLGNRPQTLNTV